MTSALWRGVPKKQTNERGCVNSVCDKGEVVKKYEIFADVICGSPLIQTSFCIASETRRARREGQSITPQLGFKLCRVSYLFTFIGQFLRLV